MVYQNYSVIVLCWSFKILTHSLQSLSSLLQLLCLFDSNCGCHHASVKTIKNTFCLEIFSGNVHHMFYDDVYSTEMRVSLQWLGIRKTVDG